MPTPNAPAPDPDVARFRADFEALTGPLPAGARIGVAVSGGADSLALLLLAQAAFGTDITAATVNHGLRLEAAAEAMAVAKICAARGIPHVTLGASAGDAAAKPAGNLQHYARMLRYRLLGKWAEEQELAFVTTAHHRDDVAESFLMRALRGAGVGGLAPMAAVAPVPYSEGPVRLVRPLLGWSRVELARTVDGAGFAAIEDPSNRDDRFDRVRIRKLIGREALLDPAMLARAAGNLGEAEAALGWAADWAWQARARVSAEGVAVDMEDLPGELRRRLAARAITALAKGWDGDGLDRLIETLGRGRRATLGGVSVSPGEAWHFRIAPPRKRAC